MKRAMRILFTVLRFGVAVALLVYLSFSGAIDWPALRGLVMAWPLTVAALVILLIDVVVTSWRLCVLMKPSGLPLSLVSSVQMSSQIGTPRRTPLKLIGPAAGPWLKTRFSSKTP